MQTRIVDLISKLSNDEITAELLRINDEMNNLFLRYSRFEKNRGITSPSQVLGKAMGVPQTTNSGKTSGKHLYNNNNNYYYSFIFF